MISGAFSFTAPVGRATNYNKDLFHVGLDGRDVLWILEQSKEMHKGYWTPGSQGDFPAATRVLFLVLYEGSRNRPRQAMSTLHGLEDG